MVCDRCSKSTIYIHGKYGMHIGTVCRVCGEATIYIKHDEEKGWVKINE